MAEFTCEIVTPHRSFFLGKLESIIFSTYDGEYEVLAGHDAVVAPVVSGVARLKGPGLDKYAAFSEGFATVNGNKVDILVDAAEWPEEIDRRRAERALERAEKRLKERTMAWEMPRAIASRDRAKARLKAIELAKVEKASV